VTPNRTEAISLALLLVIALSLGAWLRVGGVGSALLYGDEHHTLDLTLEGYGAILSTFDEYGSHLASPLLQRVALDLFGPAVWSLRLPSLVAGILSLLLFFTVARREVGDAAGGGGRRGVAGCSPHML
jgi:hypothetical protein